jgi:23S rRNA pseudouridine1911/1915/1917 synthase
MGERLQVDSPARLIDFLKTRLATWKGTTLQQRLRGGCVQVNGATVRRHDHALAAGDVVLVGDQSASPIAARGPAGLAILHSDDDLIAVDKPSGLLAVSTDRQRERTALALLREWLTRPGREARLWPVHRIDRETSGVLLFARAREVRDALQANWSQARKQYLAVVAGHPEPASGWIDQPLWEDAGLNVRVGAHPDAKQARTHYSTLGRAPDRALLEVELDTGRRHQIRAHLAWLGHPVLGDPRYGTAGGRMGLHALRLEIAHPSTGQAMVFEASPPQAFSALFPAHFR